jgi:hypothetical protein
MRHEDKIKEQRTIEATKKKLMGAGGKIGVVLRYMGEAIVDQSAGGTLADFRYLPDPYALPEEEESPYDPPQGSSEEILRKIPMLKAWLPWGEEQMPPEGGEWIEDRPDRVDHSMTTIGYHFDGLNRGMQLEIRYLDYESELKVHFKGHLVFKEVKGELVTYIPHDEWEGHIESLYKVAKKKQVKEKENTKD